MLDDARVAPDIAETEAARTIDVKGKIVTSGLIDVHAHVFEGINRTGVNPDLGGVYAGVTTIVDAGSAGATTFAGFPLHILRIVDIVDMNALRRGSPRPWPASP